MTEEDSGVRLDWVSERHLRIQFPQTDANQTRTRIRQVLAAIDNERLNGLVGVTPAHATIVLEFDLKVLCEGKIVEDVRRALAASVKVMKLTEAPIIEIPVCYEGACAPDAEQVAQLRGLNANDLIRLHSESIYVVHFIGFAPGFAYLGNLPNQLVTPRLATPRVRVPAGSVGIAGEQTGIYPGGTAGGWRLIGRTPLIMFDARRERPSLLAAGDRVCFVPISLTDFTSQSRDLGKDE
jgi:inhibitor of KinA